MNSPKSLRKNVELFPDQPALTIKGSNGDWETDTWSQVHDKVIDISKSLIASSGILFPVSFSRYSFFFNSLNHSSCNAPVLNFVNSLVSMNLLIACFISMSGYLFFSMQFDSILLMIG